MSHLLDTDTCVFILRGKLDPAKVPARLKAEKLFVSSVTVFELMTHLEKHPENKQKRQKLERFLRGVSIASFDEEAGREAARVRAELEGRGLGIGSYDTLIAGHARQRGHTLVTHNKREFSRVDGLKWEDWLD